MLQEYDGCLPSHTPSSTSTLLPPLRTSSHLDGGGHHMLLEFGLQLLQAQLDSAQALTLGGGRAGLSGVQR